MKTSESGTTDIVLGLLRGSGEQGLDLHAIENALGKLSPPRPELKRLLRDLSRSGAIVRVQKRAWAAGDVVATARGTLRWDGAQHFVEPEGRGPIHLLPQGIGPAIAGDKVVVRITSRPPDAPAVGEVIHFEPVSSRVVDGIVVARGDHLVLESDMLAEPVLLPDDMPGVSEGKAARVRVEGRAPRSFRLKGMPKRPLLAEPIGASRELGDGKPGAKEAFALVRPGETHASRLLDQLANSLRVDLPFSADAERIANEAQAPTEVEGDDLTVEPLVTIDGITAKDFDDAVAAERIGPEIRLTVTVADVSYYVPEDSMLDSEARERGCSVYLPGRVYPMLPFRLADDLCSLRPGELRRCAWVSMIIDRDGNVTDSDAGFGTMRSRHRLTYEQVQAHLEGDLLDVEDDIAESIEALEEARKRLHARRIERGMLDLDLPETRITLSEDGAGVREVEPEPRLDANRLIEECMLAANESVANLLTSMGWPHIRRVHRDPNEERVQKVALIAKSLGISFGRKGVPNVEQLNAALAQVQGRPESRALSFLLLRALAAAEYSVEELGHYGIGAPAYLHFTSPIRRYADLEVHRMLRRSLKQRAPRGRQRNQLLEQLSRSAEYANRGEKLATRAERYATRLLSARHMMDRVGEVFEGVVMEVAPFGLFVSLHHPNVEGMIPIRKLGREFFEFDEQSLSLRGTRSGTVFSVGSRVRVSCSNVTLEEGRVEFLLDGDGRVHDESDGKPSAAAQRDAAAWGVGEGGKFAGGERANQPPNGQRNRRRQTRSRRS